MMNIFEESLGNNYFLHFAGGFADVSKDFILGIPKKEVNKLNLENGTLRKGLATLKSEILQLEENIESYEAKIEVPPKN